MADIELRGGRQHNLRDINLTLPQGKLIVLAGPSGAGKSSLAIDTLFAEGQRRFIASLSAYARRFLEQAPRPDFDSLRGIGPSIAIRPGTPANNPRSTVGTTTEAQDYLRVLFANLGVAHCPTCGERVRAWTTPEAVSLAWSFGDGSRFGVMAPLQKGNGRPNLDDIRKSGFVRARISGRIVDLEEVTSEAFAKADVEIVVDRLSVRDKAKTRCAEAVELALRLGQGVCLIVAAESGAEHRITTQARCPQGHVGVPPASAALFSPNTPEGSCAECAGTGRESSAESESGRRTCGECGGARLNGGALAYLIAGMNFHDVMSLPLSELESWVSRVDAEPQVAEAVQPALDELSRRAAYLSEVGLGYLTLARTMDTLSPGEVGRVRLASQMGAGLSGVLYVLDEPSAGLHARDVERLLAALRDLRDRGNTVLVVEQNLSVLQAADHLVELGPGAGALGGEVLAQGEPEQVLETEESVTGAFIRTTRGASRERARREPGRRLYLKGARVHNLCGDPVAFPLDMVVGVTGVSGSGKSALVMDSLLPALRGVAHPGVTLEGPEMAARRVIALDQAPLGKNSRSNPASACGFLGDLRTLFAGVPEARARGYKPGRFSYNVKEGRCQRCEGVGFVTVTMHFLPDRQRPCEECGGARFNRETLEVRYRGYHFAEVLDLSVDEAAQVFAAVPAVSRGLEALRTVGLGYLQLGMPANYLSGGESQRVKIARELGKKPGEGAIYVMDEPTTGLHMTDIGRLMGALQDLVARGHSVIVVEHNLQLLAECDYLIDMGPEGGSGGGRVVVAGSPEEVAAHPESITGQHLRLLLED